MKEHDGSTPGQRLGQYIAGAAVVVGIGWAVNNHGAEIEQFVHQHLPDFRPAAGASASAQPSTRAVGQAPGAAPGSSPPGAAPSGGPETIDLGALPAHLPPAVLKAAASAVDLSVTFPGSGYLNAKGQTVQVPETLGSGIKIGDFEVLSAGHVLFNELGAQCMKLTAVSSYGGLQTAPVYHAAGVYQAAKLGAPDMAVMDLIGIGHKPLSGVPALPIRSTPLRAGEPVFFINYQNSQYGYRYPNVSNLPPGTSEGQSKPAMYGGIVLKTLGNAGKVLVATGLKSYGLDKQETFARPAGSGGEVVDASGKLVAELTNYVNPSAARKDAAGLDLQHRPAQLSMAVVQQPTDALLGSLRTDITNHPAC